MYVHSVDQSRTDDYFISKAIAFISHIRFAQIRDWWILEERCYFHRCVWSP